jgi:hypothetical protein
MAAPDVATGRRPDYRTDGNERIESREKIQDSGVRAAAHQNHMKPSGYAHCVKNRIEAPAFQLHRSQTMSRYCNPASAQSCYARQNGD